MNSILKQEQLIYLHLLQIKSNACYNKFRGDEMKKNVGKRDASIRYSLGIILVVLAILLPGTWSWWLFLPAAIAFVTGYLGVCGLYKIFGINTCKIKTK